MSILASNEVAPRARAAHHRIKDLIVETPLVRSTFFSAKTGANVYFKYESFQVSGSFKARGALSKLTARGEGTRCEFIAASTGNHGVAVAYAATVLGGKVIVFMPENASTLKARAVRQLGAEVRFHAVDSGETEKFARSYADARGLMFVSPYNDAEIICGQGTIGIEIASQVRRIDELFLSVGGGGLVSGISGYLKGSGHDVRVTGCSPLNDHPLYASILAGRVLLFNPSATIADGCAGGLEDDAITLPLARDLVDDWALIAEADIHRAMRLFLENENQLLEGSGGLAVAALLAAAEDDPARFSHRNVVVVICGSRLGMNTLRDIISSE